MPTVAAGDGNRGPRPQATVPTQPETYETGSWKTCCAPYDASASDSDPPRARRCSHRLRRDDGPGASGLSGTSPLAGGTRRAGRTIVWRKAS